MYREWTLPLVREAVSAIRQTMCDSDDIGDFLHRLRVQFGVPLHPKDLSEAYEEGLALRIMSRIGAAQNESAKAYVVQPPY